MKILISVFSYNSDINNDRTISPASANYLIHKYFFREYNFKKHLLLYTQEYYTYASKFKEMIKTTFNHEVEIEAFTEFSEDIIRTPEYLRKELNKIFSKFSKNNELYYLFNPGFGLIKYIINEFEKKYKLTILFLDYDRKKNDKPQLIALNEQVVKNKIDNKDSLEEVETYKKVYEKAKKFATEDINILIYGETGTGKEILADFIQKMSNRNNRPYEKVNCSAMANLLESRLFGHKKGSFTGAHQDQKGILELADTGTVFLDEIGDINMEMQQMLLRFLQFKEIQPIGGKSKKVDVRVISATNKNLLNLINENKFRIDLYYRLGCILELPSIRSLTPKEKEKIFTIFLMRVKGNLNKNFDLILEDRLKEFLLSYDFPGNLREIERIFENLYILADDSHIAQIDHLPDFILQMNNKSKKLFCDDYSIVSLEELNAEYCKKVYAFCNHNKSKAAKMLGISLNTLKKYLQL